MIQPALEIATLPCWLPKRTRRDRSLKVLRAKLTQRQRQLMYSHLLSIAGIVNLDDPFVDDEPTPSPFLNDLQAVTAVLTVVRNQIRLQRSIEPFRC